MDENLKKICQGFYQVLEQNIENLPQEEREKLYRPCAINCVKDYVLKEQKRQFEECHGDLNLQYEKYGRSEYFFADIIERGHVYEIGYPRCLCPMVEAGFVNSAAHCECSRQSIIYTLQNLVPDRKFSVECMHTVLQGATECRFRITYHDAIRDIWNKRHATYERNSIKCDAWLEDFKDIINSCTTPIIDLGCGSGNDTKYLIEHGKNVIPCDYTDNAIKNITKNFPEVTDARCIDMREGLPFPDGFTNVVVADLSLHYFSTEMTRKILNEIKRVLTEDGYLLLRVNSTHDVNHGAGVGTELEKHFYQNAKGLLKRFFDEDDIHYFFKDWDIFYMENKVMSRYEDLKDLWQVGVKVKQD